MTLLPLRALFWISVAMIVAIAVIPVIRFLLYQLNLRMNEFIYRFDDKTLGTYLSKFYNIKATNPTTNNLTAFKNLYKHLVGRHLYIVPLIC